MKTFLYFKGTQCNNTIRSHFAKFSHLELALVRDSSSSGSIYTTAESDKNDIDLVDKNEPVLKNIQSVPQPNLPRFKFKKTSPKLTSSDETEKKSKKDPDDSESIKLLAEENETDEKMLLENYVEKNEDESDSIRFISSDANGGQKDHQIANEKQCDNGKIVYYVIKTRQYLNSITYRVFYSEVACFDRLWTQKSSEILR